MANIDTLKQELQSLAKFGSALGLLGWDQEVNLPRSGQAFRGEVNALLSADQHKRVISNKLYKLVESLLEPAAFDKLSADDQVIVREAKRDIDQARKLPTAFVEKMAHLTTKAFSVWVEARQQSSYQLFEPVLSEIVSMEQQAAHYFGYQTSPYDALLDQFEPGMTTAKIDALFIPLAKQLSTLIASVKDTKTAVLPDATYPIERQSALNQIIVKALGYDLDAGRIDVSPHPFTIGLHPSDVRVTTRYDEHDFWVSLGSLIHEVGHALYEQGLPVENYGTALCEPASLGIHESQSRTWENFVGRSRAFVSFLYPLLQEHFGTLSFNEETLYLWLNRVQPCAIRVESDEVTYNLHIVLRYEIEKALIEGKLKPAEVPAAWNDKMKQYLGLDIQKDADGVLQDIHWSHGTFAYFPTYTLGNLYAAQLFASAQKALPNMETTFARGDFSGLLQWLRQNIHQHGRRYHADELVQRATGETLNAQYLIDHLQAKVQLQSRPAS